MKSVHDKIDKVRKPRVHITYDVETEGANIKKELPFVVGVMGDFSGNGVTDKKPLKDRSFIQIDPDNFNEVMARMTPTVDVKVANTLKNDGSEVAFTLRFKSMDDFEPAKIVEQVEPLKKLLETRAMLSELLSKADRSVELEGMLEKILQSNEDMKKLSQDLGINIEQPAGE